MTAPFPVAFNGDIDRFVVTMGNRIIVIRRDGGIFGHDINANLVGPAFGFGGSKVAFNGDIDRFVVTMNNRIIVIRRDGAVFGHDVNGNTIANAFGYSGSKVAFNGDADRFVVTMGNRIIVIRRDGGVFGHDINANTIANAFGYSGSKVAFNGDIDRFVVTMNNRIIVIRRDGAVFGHDVNGNTVANAFAYSGSKVAFNGDADRFVVTMGNRIIVIRRDGHVFAHDVNGNTIGSPFPMNFVSSSMSATEQELFDIVNDARLHPEKFPPHGNTQGAVLNACPSPFQDATALRDIARNHNAFLSTQPIAWVNTFPNMHTGPDGKKVWEAGEPMDAAGYRTFRGENVATGFGTAAEVVRFWMQDDEASAWGHRNQILNCTTREAGIGHLQGGPGGHYWTLDVGTK